MDIRDVLFYILSALILINGLLAVTSRNIFRSAVYLLFSMMGVAGLYFWMNYEFVAAVQIVVYVGGIVVLIIFSIFLTHHVGKEMERPAGNRMLFALTSVLLAFIISCTIVLSHPFPASPEHVDAELSVAQIGRQMLQLNENGYILPFEVISILLLAAMIGCIVIALKPEPQKT